MESHYPATGLRGPPHRTIIPRPPGPGSVRPTEGPLDPPPRPQIGQTWSPGLLAQCRRWSLEGTIRELIDTRAERSVFSEEPTVPLWKKARNSTRLSRRRDDSPIP